MGGRNRVKVNQKMTFFGFEMDFFFGFSISVWVRTRVLKSWVFNIRSWTQIWTPEFWHPRKTECFQFSTNLFLCNCWFHSLFLYKPQKGNLEFATSFSVIALWCSAAKEVSQTQLFKTRVLIHVSGVLKLRFPNFGFKIDIENPKLEKLKFWSTLISPLPDLWILQNYNCLFLVGKKCHNPF